MSTMHWIGRHPAVGRAMEVSRKKLFSSLAVLALVFSINTNWLAAQTGGQGALEGTVTDSTGAVVPNATVTATNQASNVSTTRTSSSAGLYTITPLIPGVYNITVTAQGFQVFKQQNIEVNGLTVTGFNASLLVGSSEQTVTVSTAPPQLQTTNPTLGATITNETYESLPNIMNGQQRDPTAFATLAPGAQGGTRAPIMSGTGNFLAEVYVDGIPTTTPNQQGDNRTVSNSIPVEAVDQMQVVSGGPGAEYQGAGAISFTTKSGGDKYHGTAADFIRNTIFDTWGFTAPAGTTSTVVNGKITKVPATKPVEHQNELSGSVGGPIPFLRHKGFFFVNYDQFHNRTGVSPSQFTVPTTLMTQGNFTELGSGIYLYNPLTNSCAGANCTRQPFMGTVNGVPTANVIPASFLSPISQYEQKFMPAPTIGGIANNFLSGGIPTGFDNHELVFKVDFDVTQAQRLSFAFTHGVRKSVGFGANLPLPYTASDRSDISPTIMIFEHSITLNQRMVNQFKFGFTRFPQPVFAPTAGLAPFRGGPDVGIGGLPVGQAADNFPGSAFSTTTAFPAGLSPWTENGASDASHNVVPNAYTLVDNFQWSKGQHSLTFGIETQWLEDNVTSQSTPSGIYHQTWSGLSTANYVGSNLNSTATGYSYADFLLGAVASGATSVPLFIETGGRYHPISPYFQDDWKIRQNLTLNLGLRYDYLPPFEEVQDRWSFFNPNITNPLTNSPGQLEYAGNRGSAISCNCRTPVQTYWKNFGPRLGFEWSMDPRTVMRGGFAMAYTRSGGVGGRQGDSTGTGQDGFGSNIVLNPAVNSGITAGPSYYLNNGAAFTAAGIANTNFGGPGYVIPPPAGPSAASLTLGIGNFVDPVTNKYVTPSGAPGYADPYLSGRAPEFEFYNFGMQRAITNNLTITVNYAGSQSHFIGGAGVPGFWSGQIDPAHVALTGSTLATDNATNILNAPATAANIAIAQKADPSIQIPYAGYAAAGSISTTPTIGRMLRPYPQYSSPPSPEWDNIANLSYNALQITLAQREWKGLSYTVNYTYSRNIGDDGTARSAFFVPAAASSNGQAIPGNNRADRDLTTDDTPQILNIYGLDRLPFGKGHLGGNNFLVRNLIGGWSVSGIFTYNSGNPLLVTGSGCTTPSAGTCMPDLVPGMQDSIRQNGSWGKGLTAANLSAVHYLNTAAFQLPAAFPLPAGASSKAVAVTKVGDAPRTSLNLWSPSRYNLNASLQRTFNITPERVKFVFQADAFNVSNKVTFGGINTTWSPAASSTFGEVTSASGNRDFQFSGRINF